MTEEYKKVKNKSFFNKFENSENPEENSIGIMLAFLYIVSVFIAVLLLFPEPIKEHPKKVYDIKEVIFAVLTGTTISLGFVIMFTLVTNYLTICISESKKIKKFTNDMSKKYKVVKYNFYNVICDTVWWTKKICDSLFSILLPCIIALYFFENSKGKNIVESVSSFITVSLLPTLVLLNISLYIKVLLIGLFENVKVVCYFFYDFILTIYILWLLFVDFIKPSQN